MAATPTEAALRATCLREHPHCFACRDAAEGGLGLQFRVMPDGGVEATWTGTPAVQSYAGVVHGGLSATLLDAAMVHALFARGIAGVTGELRIRYRGTVRIGQPVTVRAWLMRDFAPGFALEAELSQGDSRCVEASGKFMRRSTAAPVPQSDAARLGVRSTVRLEPIGVIRSEHIRAECTPIQPAFAAGCRGRVELLPGLAPGLDDLTGFSHIYLIYHLDRAGPPRLHVKPFLQEVERGIFATRAPCRPNPLGLSLVRLLAREGPVLHVDGIDVLDGTPLLDLKPYAPCYERVEDPRGGWTDEVSEAEARERGRRGYRPAAP